MLLLLRFLRVVVYGLLAPRRPILEESRLHFRALPNDIDLNFHLNDGRYMSFMGIGRGDLLMRSGLLRKVLERKWAPVVGSAMIRYRREVRPLARFELRTRVLGWDDKWIYVGHVVVAGGKTSAVAYIRAVFRGRSGAVPTKDVLALVGWNGPSPELPEVVKNWPELEAE